MGAPKNGELSLLFKQRSYLTILVGNTVSRFGDSIDSIAFAWMVYAMTGSTLIMGTLFAVSMIPNLLFGFVAGVVADRFPRKPIVVAAHALRGVSVGCVALLYGGGMLEPWMLFLFGMFNSTVEAFAGPASSGLFQRIVPKDLYLQANSFSQSASSLAELVGLAAAGVLIAFIGIAGAIAVDAATFLFACLMTLSISVPDDRPAPAEAHPKGAVAGFVRDLKEGMRFVWSDKLIRITTLLAGFVNFAVAPIGVLQAAYVKEVLGIGPDGMAFLGIGFSLGIMAGGFALALFGKKARRLSLILGGFLAVGVFYAMMGLPALFVGTFLKIALAVAACFLTGAAIPLINATIGAYLMERTPPNLMGRTNSVLSMLCMGAMPLGAALSGIVAEYTSIPFIFVAMGALVVAVTFFVSRLASVRGSLAETLPVGREGAPVPGLESRAADLEGTSAGSVSVAFDASKADLRFDSVEPGEA